MSCIGIGGRTASGDKLGYRPREGYELHPHELLEDRKTGVIVPVRGMSCIAEEVARAVCGYCYRPREGYELHRQK